MICEVPRWTNAKMEVYLLFTYAHVFVSLAIHTIYKEDSENAIREGIYTIDIYYVHLFKNFCPFYVFLCIYVLFIMNKTKPKRY